MVFMKAFSMGKKMFGGGKKKKPAPKAAGVAATAPGEQVKAAATKTVKELRTPVRAARKPMRMRAGARKAMGRGSSRSGGR